MEARSGQNCNNKIAPQVLLWKFQKFNLLKWSHLIFKDLTFPIGKFMNTSLPLRNSACAFSSFLLRIVILNTKCQAYTRNGFKSCGVSSQFSSALFSERAKSGNKII